MVGDWILAGTNASLSVEVPLIPSKGDCDMAPAQEACPNSDCFGQILTHFQLSYTRKGYRETSGLAFPRGNGLFKPVTGRLQAGLQNRNCI